MSLPEQCNHCSLSGWACPRHATDLNYPAGGFPDDEPFAGGVDELGFAGHGAGGPFPWLAEEPAQGELHPARPGYGFSDLLRSAGDPSRIQFTLNWGSSEEGSPFRDLPPAEAPVNGLLTSGSKMSLPWNTPASNSSESAKEAEDVITNIEPQVVDTTMDREARVQRYKEKKKRRKFEKQIRYASRKAYAEMRPRVKGRFAKATDASQASSTPAYTPQPFDMGWFRP